VKIYIANQSHQKLGGGFTFLRNLTKGLAGKVDFVLTPECCDIYFIASATMVSRDEVVVAKNLGKKIVLRVDNIPRNSRNRNTGTSRLFDFAQLADLIIYQSRWAKDFIGKFIDPGNDKNWAIIYNGVDKSVFRPDGEKIPKDGKPQYLYVRYNRDENKRWEDAWFYFQKLILKGDRSSHLWIVGNFSNELAQYNFDFFGGAEKRYHFWGNIESREEMARIYRSADILLMPFVNDACSNTFLEARISGCIIDYLGHIFSGGTLELMYLSDKEISLDVMCDNYLNKFLDL